MKAVITGATGCIGRNLLELLVQKGWEVTVLHRKNSNTAKLKNYPVQLKEINFHNLDSLVSAIPDGADAVFNVGANLSHWPVHDAEQWKDNVDGVKNLVKASRIKNIKRFIHTSTGAASLATEKHFVYMNYSTSKWESEKIILEAIQNEGLDGIIIRLPIVMGRYDEHNYGAIFSEMKKGPFKISFPGNLIFAKAEDVALGHLLAFEKGQKGKTYFFGGEWATWYDVFCKISKLVGSPYKPRRVPAWFLYIVSYFMLWVSYLTRREPLLTPQLIYLVNGSKERSDVKDFLERGPEGEALGYKKTSLDQTLSETYNWLKANGKL